MRITQTKGNETNGVKGSRLRVWRKYGTGFALIGELIINTHNALLYCFKYPTGKYARKLKALIVQAEEFDGHAG
ncbi:MAG: hypothetical protein OQK77_00450 [Psychromonas sp.]|nr:hypothetical protein [Psychromonas sp.]